MAATIRQELNILNSVITGATDDLAHVQLDTAQYSGTATYYLEIVAKIASGSENVTLRRKGTTTDDATIAVTGSTAYIRFRSSSFTPPAGATEYMVHCASTNANVQSARIIVIQTDSTGITSTETQIEIGNTELAKVNTSAAALSFPKYWKYDASKVDGTVTAYAEIVWAYTGTGNGTVKLQKDGGSDNFSFSDDTTIVSAGTAATATRVRIAFTPTDGRNYRIVTQNSSSMGSLSIYNAKIVIQQLSSLGDRNTGTTTVGTEMFGGTSGGQERLAQSFQLSTACTVSNIRLRLLKSGTPSDTLTVAIVSALDGTPISSATLGMSSLTGSFANYDFSVSAALSASTTYYIQISRSGGRDTSNYAQWEITTGNAYTNGAKFSRSSTVWDGGDAAIDLHFILTTNGTATPLSKVEAQYLLANTGSFGGSTGLKDYDTLYDPAEWDAGSGSITYLHEGNGAASGTGDIKLQSDPNGTPADVTTSTITDTIQRERTAALTMPGASATIDVNVTGTGTLNASRILAQWTFVGSTTTDQTITGLARVEKTVDTTQTGKGNISNNTDQAITGVARIQTTVDRTTTGVSRVERTVDVTQTGVGNISNTTDRTITGAGRIEQTVDQAITGLARVTVTVDQTQTGLARVEKTVDQTITGAGRVEQTMDQTQTGKGRVEQTVDVTQPGVARVEATTDQTQPGVARIEITTDRTQTGAARIEVTVDQPITGVAAIEVGDTETLQTIDGIARVTVTTDQTQAGVGRIERTVDQDQTGTARIERVMDATQDGIARIEATIDQDITGRTRVEVTTDRTQDGRARVEQTVDVATTGLSRITATVDQTVSGTARIEATTDRTQLGTARIEKTVDQTATGKARVEVTVDRAITGVAALANTADQTITGVSRITAPALQSLTGVARIQRTVDRTQTGVARIERVLTNPYSDQASPYAPKTTPFSRKVPPYTPQSSPYSTKPSPYRVV